MRLILDKKPTRKNSDEENRRIRFFNQGAENDLPRDRILAQIYDPTAGIDEAGGYGANLTLSTLRKRAEEDPALMAELSQIFGPLVTNRPPALEEQASPSYGFDEFADRFTSDPNFARMFVPVEGSRGELAAFEAHSGARKGGKDTEACKPGNKGAGASVACDPGKARKLGKSREGKNRSNLDKLMHFLKTRVGGYRNVKGGGQEGKQPTADNRFRYGVQIPMEDPYKDVVLQSAAEGDVKNLMMILGALPGQGQNFGTMGGGSSIDFSAYGG